MKKRIAFTFPHLYAFGGGEITSSMVVWEEKGDEAGLVYIMPVLVALIVGIIIYGRQLIKQAKRI